jgi:nucleoid-associated protein YgaU
LKKTREKTEVAIADLEGANKKLAEQREKMIKMNRELEELEKKKLEIEKGIKNYQTLEPEVGRKVFRHKVQKGESLRSLAEKYYGDANKWNLIFDANQNQIKRGVLKEGQDILIP